jgi:hypothetical protein
MTGRIVVAAAACAASIAMSASVPTQEPGAVTVVRLPDGGIQPQAVSGTDGAIHVVYFKGAAAAGDLFYARLAADGTWTVPLQVNSGAGSAIATGSVRGAQLAVGAGGRVHVAWNGSSKALPPGPGGATPMLYARLDDAKSAFEPERNLIRWATGLDGGGAVAADRRGRVFVAWHAGGPDSKNETDRLVWVAVSTDEGRTFSRERVASDISTGACGCCGMDAVVDHSGTLFLLYRSARDLVHRDTYLLASRDGARTFTARKLQEWNINACPMSTFSLAEGADGPLAAWETAGQVQFARVTAGDGVRAIQPAGDPRTRRHPSLAVNASGDTLLAWTEGTGWNRGGAVAWQVFDRNGRPAGEPGRAPGLSVWGLVAAAARADGRFVVIY